ncbi:unnamed protein product [Closterium sp. NIES-53]
MAPWPLPAATTTTTATAATTAATATAATVALACCATMASLRVLAFDHEGRPAQFDTWLDDLQLYLLSDSKDTVSLFDLASGAATAPPATVDSATRSQWLTRDAIARLAIRNHLPLAECAHFGQHKTAQALYDAIVARYSSPATAALGRLLLPYLFPELSAFATVEDLVSHLCTSDARYRTTVPTEFLDKNQPPMFITLYFIVTRLPDSLRSVRDHILSLDPTSLTVDLLEQHLLAAETSAVVVGAARCTPRPPFFEGCSPSPLAPSYASAAAADVSVAADVGAASASAKRRSGKGKGGKGGGGGDGGGKVATGVVVGAAVEVVEAVEVVAAMGLEAGARALVAAVEAAVGVAAVAAVGLVAVGLELGVEAMEVASGSSRCVERPRWADLLRYGVAIFDLDFDAILSAMYALSASAEGDCYLCVPPDPGIEAAALGASESGTLPGTVPAAALHIFMLDSGASCCFFRDSTTLTPLSAPVPVILADPSEGPIVARSSTALPCMAVPFGSLSGLYLPSFSTNLRVSIYVCIRTGRHMATFTHRPGSSLYTLATEPPQVATSAQVSASGQIAASYSCRLLSHQTLLWHHRLYHPSQPRLRGMHSRLLVSGLPRSLPPLPPSPATPCLPCVEGRQRAAPHSSSFPPTTAPLARAASPTISRLLATAVTDPSFESAAASALVAELLDFAAAYHVDYATALDAESTESAYANPPSVGGDCALGTDVLEDRKEDFESITGPYSSQWQAAMDAEMASWKSTSTYVDEVPPPRVNIVDGMWIFRVKRPPGSPPAFNAHYVARGCSQRLGVDNFQTFSPTPKMTTLEVLLHVAAQRDYELHSPDFSTAFLYVTR